MNSDSEASTPADDPTDWKNVVCDRIVKLEGNIPEPHWMEGEWPTWTQRAMQEYLKACFPDGKFKVGASWTPRELGAILGAQVGLLKWLCDENGFAKSKAAAILEDAAAKLSVEQKAAKEAEVGKFMDGITNYLGEFDGVIATCLAAGASGETDEQKEFFGAYVSAMQRGERGLDVGTYGTTATPIYIYLVINWRAVEREKSVAALYEVCTKAFSVAQIGELKTFQKLCQRIGLKLRAPGRPRKKK